MEGAAVVRSQKGRSSPVVTDTRNVLLVRIPSAQDDEFLYSAMYALSRGLQLEFEVEERELSVGADRAGT